ncbi:MAG: helix-turn-helix domain-containing protein [Dehalococcoidia bacterium]
MSEKLTVSVAEAASLLGISKNLAYRLFSNGELHGAIRLGSKRIVVSKAAIERLVNEAETKVLSK